MGLLGATLELWNKLLDAPSQQESVWSIGVVLAEFMSKFKKKLPLSAYFWNKRHKSFESLPDGCGSRPYSSPRNVSWEKNEVAFGEELNSLLMPPGQRLQYTL